MSADALIAKIHHAGRRLILAVTGGGASTLGALLAVPGGSRSILEGIVPYSEEALAEFLGRRPEHACSVDTAMMLAERALERARRLAPGERVAGVGCTASLASDRPKRGNHRVHLATRAADASHAWSLTLNKGARDRAGEEQVVSILLLNAVATIVGIPERLEVPLFPGEVVETSASPAADPVLALLNGERPSLFVGVDGRIGTGPSPPLLLPGAFNPTHAGHWKLAEVAARQTGTPAAFEISVVNVDKPPLPVEEVRRRIAQFTWHAPVWLTRAPTFLEKARLFPGATFVVGCDTAERIVMPRYYDNSVERMLAALAEIQTLGSSFLVAGRRDSQGSFRHLEHLTIPDAFRNLFVAIAATDFQVDISSTELRAGR